MKKTIATLALLLAIVSIGTVGCLFDTVDKKQELQDAIKTFNTESMDTIVRVNCTCLANPESTICKEKPKECYTDMETCETYFRSDNYTEAQYNCAIEAVSSDPEPFTEAMNCRISAIRSLARCHSEINNCETDEVIACAEAHNKKYDNCRVNTKNEDLLDKWNDCGKN